MTRGPSTLTGSVSGPFFHCRFTFEMAPTGSRGVHCDIRNAWETLAPNIGDEPEDSPLCPGPGESAAAAEEGPWR